MMQVLRVAGKYATPQHLTKNLLNYTTAFCSSYFIISILTSFLICNKSSGIAQSCCLNLMHKKKTMYYLQKYLLTIIGIIIGAAGGYAY